jgi:hypothetical protein
MQNKVYVGIDPGISGGVCVIDRDGNANAIACPKTPMLMGEELFGMLPNDGTEVVGVIEHVHAFPTDGRSSAFKFGRNFGQWEGILSEMNVPYTLVTPYTWQKHFECPKFDTKKLRKRWLKTHAEELYPQIKVTFKVSDSILIARYCMDKDSI